MMVHFRWSCPAPGGRTRLAGMPTRSAGLSHRWGTNICRMAAAHTDFRWRWVVVGGVQVMKEHGDELNFDILSEMDHLHCCVKEALRLHPPLIMLMRYCHKAFTVRSTPPAARLPPRLSSVGPNLPHATTATPRHAVSPSPLLRRVWSFESYGVVLRRVSRGRRTAAPLCRTRQAAQWAHTTHPGSHTHRCKWLLPP